MVFLPRYVAFKSKLTGLYLRYVNDGAPYNQSFLQSMEENVVSPYTKFELETAKCDSSLVNIRCCYNNKYWVTEPSGNSDFIVAKGKKIEEDKSKWTCTLFKPIYDGTEKAYRFRHVHLDRYVSLSRSFPGNFLHSDRVGFYDKHSDLSTIMDWEALLILPKHIALKADNGCYIRALRVHRLALCDKTDIGDSGVLMETFPTKDGRIRIKSDYVGMFWRNCSRDYIWADSTDHTDADLNTLFCPIKIDNSTIALRNLGNNRFLSRVTAPPIYVDRLSPCANTIDKYTKFQISEAVLSREIYNVRFRPSDARIYNQSVLVMATRNATNRTEVPNTVSLRLKYTDTKSKTWSSSLSLKLGVKTTLQTKVPFLVKGEIEMSAEFSGAYQWGVTETTSRELEPWYQVTVPPMTSLIVSLLATKGTCDVPYSYTQRDVLFNGETTMSHQDDGVYTGTSCYNFTYQTKKIPMTDEQQ